MANPTTNFGWVMPTSTDLVTDLPADFNVFGQGVDTTLADLKGGTTGQILSKASATDMDFTWIANDQGDITGVTATSPLTGGGTSGAITVGIQDATTSVKGAVQLSDSTSTTSSVLASTPTATKSAYDLAASAYAPAFTNNIYAGKNKVINGAFNVWQRGTSVAVAATSTVYTSDRFTFINGANQACTIARQATNDTTNLPFIQYCARVQRNSGQTGTGALIFGQPLDTATSIPFAGKTVVYSFYARAGANYSATSNALTAYLIGGTGTDQALTGFTGATVIIGSSATLTTTWQRFTFSAAVASTYTQLGVRLDYTPTGTAGTNDYYEVTGIQLEIGSTATPFQTASGTIGGELALCQRYYVRLGASAAYDNYGSGGFGISTTVAQMAFPLPVQMRVTPTSVDYANLSLYNSGFTAVTSFALGAGLTATPQTAFGQSTVASGLTQYRNYWLSNNNLTTAYIGFSAEL